MNKTSVYLCLVTRYILIIQLEEGSRTEHLQVQKCRARFNHLESADAENLSEWNNTRLKRILVDYMLRMSYYESAEKLAESSNMLVTVPLLGCPLYLHISDI